jgi:hypothetical protein
VSACVSIDVPANSNNAAPTACVNLLFIIVFLLPAAL